MANKRYLPCGKVILAIGQPLSIADCKEKIEACFSCVDFPFCVLSQETFYHVINQQNNLSSLIKIEKLKEKAKNV